MKRQTITTPPKSPSHRLLAVVENYHYNGANRFQDNQIILFHASKSPQDHHSSQKSSKSKNKKSTSKSKQNCFNLKTKDLENKINRARNHYKYQKISTASQQKQLKHQKFKRNSKNNEVVVARKSLKKIDIERKSTENENEQTLVERLEAENQFFKKAYSKQKAKLMEAEIMLEKEMKIRVSEKRIYSTKIQTLKKIIETGKVRLGHIYSYDKEANIEQAINTMIVETDNENSSIVKLPLSKRLTDELAEDLKECNDLSIESK